MALVGENQWTQDELIELLSSFQLSLFAFTGQNRIGVFEGINELGGSIVVCTESRRVVVVDGDNGCLLQVRGADLSSIKHNEILDLSDEGNRWEGDVWNDEPCGWGVMYDRDNQKVYEGFRIGEVNVCYGCKYYSNTEMIEYEGEWCEGMRWGRGVKFDRSRSVVFDGEWLNDGHLERRVVITSECAVFHNRIEELVVNDDCCNEEEWKVLDLSFISCLKSLRVGCMCFCYVEKVKLIGLSKLESVEIGFGCFKTKKRRGKDLGYSFCLKDCPKLKSLKIGLSSFSDYTVCEIANMDALGVIEIGELNEYSRNFKYASLELKSVGWMEC